MTIYEAALTNRLVKLKDWNNFVDVDTIILASQKDPELLDLDYIIETDEELLERIKKQYNIK